jgi:exodeoxyribonuclease V alpha subunit
MTATGLLETFTAAGAIDTADMLVAQRLTALAGDADERVALAVAFAVRAVRGGSVCVQLSALHAQLELSDLPWPAADEWEAVVAGSVLAGSPPVVHIDGGLMYLDRYWLEERQVARDILGLAYRRHQGAAVDVDRMFPKGFEEQRRAAEIALSRGLMVLTGGPGTGKTTTIARLLALLAEQAETDGKSRLRIALAAPTGKAAARLQEAVQLEIGSLGAADRARLGAPAATTLHRLLGPRPDTSSRFRHHRENRLPYDVVVVDETSMVSLTMMARLVEAVRPQSRLLLVGDPDQLASVEAGAVLADLVEGFSGQTDSPVATLATSHRFGASISDLAGAIRLGDADRTLEVLATAGDNIEWLDTADVSARLRTVLLPTALRLREAAMLGNSTAALAILDDHRLLCAHRRGPYGVEYWNHQVERWLSEETDSPQRALWYAGRPVLATANDYGLGLYNGDTGVAILRDGALRVMIAEREFAIGRLADVETMHAMTIHKSQGSQVAEITVLLPAEDSRLLTRELLYTAVTRAQDKVRIVGSEDQVRAALERRAIRATGLKGRLAHQSREQG